MTDAEKKTAVLLCPVVPSFSTIAELQRHLNADVQFNTINKEDFDSQLRKAYSRSQSEATQMAEDLGEDIDLDQLIQDIPQATDLLEEADDAPIIKLINALFNQAIREQASDIHVEAYENYSVVRFRIDGVLKDITNFHRGFHGAVVSRLKVMAKLDIAEPCLRSMASASCCVFLINNHRALILPTWAWMKQCRSDSSN
jgi:general secretion pathway protein E